MTDLATPAAAISSTDEFTLVDHDRLACDGGADGLGHPRVYLTIGNDGTATCTYCDKKYKLSPDAKSHH
jgi:uncharacterized Zn-finger protein